MVWSTRTVCPSWSWYGVTGTIASGKTTLVPSQNLDLVRCPGTPSLIHSLTVALLCLTAERAGLPDSHPSHIPRQPLVCPTAAQPCHLSCTPQPLSSTASFSSATHTAQTTQMLRLAVLPSGMAKWVQVRRISCIHLCIGLVQ
jgi:hypothetical protein